MTETKVYVLFGDKKSIGNYFISVNYLIRETPSLDYMVRSYGPSNFRNSKDFLEHLNRYQEFLFIPQQEFDLIYHALCSKARAFIRNTI